MKSLHVSFLERKKASLCILAGLCAISLFVIINSDEKIKQNTGGAYVVKIKHYGIDAAEMERSITIPLEDIFSSIPGIMSVQSSSENSLSTVFIRFKHGSRGRYEAVRDAAQRVYESLPSSVQRPEIFGFNNSMVPVWSAAVVSEEKNIFTALEKTVKPRLESLEGAGEVLVSGAGLKEICITLNQEKLSLIGLEASFVASVLAMNDSIFTGGSVVQQNREIIITADGRYDSLTSLYGALIPLGDGKFIELSQIAQITEMEREPDVFSRLNGKKTASIAIMGRHGADLRKLSSGIKRELSALVLPWGAPLEYVVLSDIGAEEAAAFKSVFNAALLGAIMVAVIGFLLNKNNSGSFSGFFCALAIPLICLISAAVLSAAGFSMDRLLLAGIAAGIGTAVDAVILCSERLRKSGNYSEASAALLSLLGPLLAGAATTVAALIPLTAIDDNAKTIASAIAVVTITAFIMSFTLLPPLLLWRGKQKREPQTPGRMQLKLSRLMNRFLAATVKFCFKYPALVLAASFVITVSAIILMFARGADTSGFGSEDSVYAQIEFDGGLLAQETDRLAAIYVQQLLKNEEIINAETGARTGSCSLLISFDPKKTKAHLVRDLAKQIHIPGGFIFFHESSIKDRYWEIFIYGDEDKKLRELAEELAHICREHPMVRDRVLNFKQGSKKLILLPDREKFAETKISFSDAAVSARLGVYGPVAYKRIDSNGETDVRIRKGGYSDVFQTRESTLNLLVSSLQLGSLMETKDEREPSSIRRDNRRRYASITITTKPMDPRRVKQEMAFLFKKLNLPPGYSIEFDPEAIKKSEGLSATVLSLIMAIVFCYMIIASINESFKIPLLILSAIPASLAIPAICLGLSGSMYNLAIACAFIAVSGMTVNAAVLCTDSIRTNILAKKEKTFLCIYSALRRKMPALLATSATSVAGAIPFLFLTEGANMLIRTLALVGALGVAASCLCSITIIPSLLFLTKFKLILPVQDKKQNFGVKHD
ncbi:MAG: efflux RND transporter permease subunit [Treponema sp.]|nr:efflux RND transporter permease subunit [Treponema sp.]